MRFDNVHVYNFQNALRGMRNPKNSWHLSDSEFGYSRLDDMADITCDMLDLQYPEGQFDSLSEQEQETIYDYWMHNITLNVDYSNEIAEYALIGPKDMKLAQTLIKSGPEHRKFLRQIFVSVDITAPLYWWKEFDTYKVGTVANSTSTMHKLTSKPITPECFELDDYCPDIYRSEDNVVIYDGPQPIIDFCESLRQKYLETEDKRYWKELVRWLPESWLQTRTVTMSYENLFAICSKSQRRFHKLTEWSGDGENFEHPSFIKFARALPYASEFIFIDELDI